jgi:hypothetical protein
VARAILVLTVLVAIGAVALIVAGFANVAVPSWLHEAFASFALISVGGLFAFFPKVVREMNLRAAPTDEAGRHRYIQANSPEHYATIGRVIGVACVLGGLVVAGTLLFSL